ncbi:saccharopine dehydrogenase [Paenibacillus sp. 481]|uniref:saccharopine dehydrogenase n=1 Tax=Paenibacillus sp. 481 TaxID=2835869 RepID=UPI001E54B7F9|nr:saccharopine dehydrogenase [Paenibacillus sp. 481]UHA75997.1 saccharopine dehydrogenase [Paenibacillus sp. 481]
MEKKSVLIVGGYGVVGSQIAQILHKRHPELEIWLGGRRTNAALPFESPRVRIVRVDNSAANPLEAIAHDPTLIINVVNDLEDRLLLAAINRKIPLVDVTRWTERFQQSIDRLSHISLQSSVVLASGWMGGTAALLAKVSSDSLRDIAVNIHALYSLKDKAGPDSTAYMDRMSIPFSITDKQVKRSVYPMTDPVKVRFPNNYETNCYRLDTPDHVTLPTAIQATTANFRIAFDSKASTFGLVLLARTGIWKMMSRSMRQGVLYNPGSGSPHHLVIHVQGKNSYGRLEERTMSVTDPLGQTHLTALGAVIQAENLLRPSSGYVSKPQIYFPEHLVDSGLSSAEVFEFYGENGVVIGSDFKQ